MTLLFIVKIRSLEGQRFGSPKIIKNVEQSVEEGLANPLRFFANLLTVPLGQKT